MSKLIYLDNAATTKPAKEAAAAMALALEEGFYNPSSLYAAGYAVRKSIEDFRGRLVAQLGAGRLVFTSGGTEANNLAIQGLARSARRRGRILFSAVEHSAVAEACRSLQAEHEVLAMPVDRLGRLDLEAAKALLTPDTLLICLMQVNNEVGTIQPLEEIIRLRDATCPEALLHVDGVQGFMRLPVLLGKGVDSYALSAHKIHGPKGIGALALGARAKVSPMVFGGNQEEGLRSGTENTAGIFGLEAAVKAWPALRETRRLKARLYANIKSLIPGATLNGPEPESELSAEHILNLSFPPVRAQTLMNALEQAGVLVSQGSACSSRARKPSVTLQAMGLNRALQDSALRFSLSHHTTGEDADTAAEICAKAYNNLKQFTRR